MYILAILCSYFLNEKLSLDNFRNTIYSQIILIINKFIKLIKITNQRKLRLLYFYICLPFVILDLGINLILEHHYVLYYIFNIFIFVVCVDITSWKKPVTVDNSKHLFFISDFSNRFFAPSIWFIILPYSTGLIVYFLVLETSKVLKENKVDSQVYNITIDKILFYVNLVPYFILYIFIALVSNFEDVLHCLLEYRHKFIKSYYFLLKILHEMVLIAIRKEHFKLEKNQLFDSDINDIYIHQIEYSEDVITYISALLNRIIIFLISVMICIYIIRMF